MSGAAFEIRNVAAERGASASKAQMSGHEGVADCTGVVHRHRWSNAQERQLESGAPGGSLYLAESSGPTIIRAQTCWSRAWCPDI